MYQILYSENKIGIKKGNSIIPIDDKNSDYQQYLKDIEADPTCVIDNPPSQAEILERQTKAQALNELNTLDKKMPRATEDLYDTLKANGLLTDDDMPNAFKATLNQKKQERKKL